MLPAVLAAVVCGCMSRQVIPASDALTGQLRGAKITAVAREAPAFESSNASFLLAGLGLLPALASVAQSRHSGTNILEEFEVGDPAIYIRARLVADLAAKYGVVPVDSPGDLVADTSAKALSARFAHAHFVLDVRTERWGLMVHPVRWNRYFVLLDAQVRLIDTATGRSVAQWYCSHGFDRTGERPTREELLAGRAQRLKDELQANADDCIHAFEIHVGGPEAASQPSSDGGAVPQRVSYAP